MNTSRSLLITVVIFLAITHTLGQEGNKMQFSNPVSISWLGENILNESPRLILTPELEKDLIRKLETDPLTQSAYRLLQNNAESICKLEPLTYQKTGKRLLSVSREAIRRMTTLALVYRIDKNEAYLMKLEKELEAVCRFSDWNPSHFLDVAEMALAVSLAVDWTGEWLDPSTRDMALEALVEKALKPSVSGDNWWINAHHNWNLVCHGGMSFAALAVYEKEPELASDVLHRSVDKIPLGLMPYAPDGVYPEGPSYWFYATDYLTAAISVYESALGTDFGFSAAPGVMESTIFSQVLAGPSGDYFNFFDSGLGGFHSLSHFSLLAWFARHGAMNFDADTYLSVMEKELEHPGESRRMRFLSLAILNISSLPEDATGSWSNPEVWIGKGASPLCIIRNPQGGKEAFFLAAKGGSADDNHGNMDAGSFVFELEGVRWSVDPGNQGYHTLEQLMGNELWNRAQDSRRWTLLTKNNFGHSTLTINGEMHLVAGRAVLVNDDPNSNLPAATFDLTPVFGNKLERAQRSFRKLSETQLLITDDLVFNEHTALVTWQLVTKADIRIDKGRVILEQDGRQLFIRVRSDQKYRTEVVSLSPPPLEYDKNIEGLKRLDIHFKRKDFSGHSGKIEVELSNQ